MSLPTTPTEKLALSNGPLFVKRDDLCRHPSGAWGGKTRAADPLLKKVKADGYDGVVIALARNSSIPAVLTKVAAYHSLAAAFHIPYAKTELPADLQMARVDGAEVIEHKPGYQSVLVARARAQAEGGLLSSGKRWYFIPLGLECSETVTALTEEAAQTDYPTEISRLVIPVGSGMMLAGILHGLKQRFGQPPFQVLGIMVGHEPYKCLDKYAPQRWRSMVELVPSPHPFMKAIHQTILPIELDPYYEAKLASFLQPNDMLWVVAKRASLCK